MYGQTVEIPGAVRKLLHPGELARRVASEGAGIGEVVVRAREVPPQRLLGGGQFGVAQEPLHEREATFAHLGKGGVGDPHQHRTLGQRLPVGCPSRAYDPANARGDVRHVRPRVPGLVGRDPRARTSGPLVGPDRGHDRRDLRQRPPPVHAQHGTLAHPGLHRDLPLRARSRDGRAGRRGRWQLLGCRRDEGGHRPLHPVPSPWHRPALRQLRARLDLVLPQPGQPHRQLGAVTRVHHGSGRGVGRERPGARLHAPPDARRASRTAAPACTNPSPSPATASCGPRPSTANLC